MNKSCNIDITHMCILIPTHLPKASRGARPRLLLGNPISLKKEAHVAQADAVTDRRN